MNDFWNARYASDAYAYGEQPNAYFKAVVDTLSPGRILVPGAGEGRDAIYAAALGWQVVAFDLSTEGRRKALQLAQRNKVTVDYHILDAAGFAATKDAAAPEAGKYGPAKDEGGHTDADPSQPTYDLIALIFLHLPYPLRKFFHRGMVQRLKPGGMLLMEAFTPQQLNYSSGGPKDPNMLYTPNDMKSDFEELQIIENRELVVDLNEGSFHQGLASVLRFRGVK